jgi:putative DNA primase/helicase
MTNTINELQKAERALSYVDASDRSTWIKMGAALKTAFGDQGFSSFDRWSQTANNYNEKSVKSAWKSIQANKINIGTLYFTAKQNGFVLNSDEYSQPKTQLPLKESPAMKSQTEQQAQKDYEQVTYLAALILKNGTTVDADYPYLAKKDIAQAVLDKNPLVAINKDTLPHVLAQAKMAHPDLSADLTALIQKNEGNLIIPLFHKGLDVGQFKQGKGYEHVTTAQIIAKDQPFKGFLPKGKMQGSYAVIGGVGALEDKLSGHPVTKPAEQILIAEGYATAATLHQATGQPVFVAFSANNLAPVLKNVLEQWPGKQVVICADNDQNLTGLNAANAAIDKAKNSLNLNEYEALNLSVMYPKFNDRDVKDFQALTKSTTVPTDFNDLAKLYGSAIALKGSFKDHVEEQNAKKRYWLARKLTTH